jgi:hypothetical protein
MALHRRLQAIVFEPEVITILEAVYGQVCDELGLHPKPDGLCFFRRSALPNSQCQLGDSC